MEDEVTAALTPDERGATLLDALQRGWLRAWD